MQASTGYSKLWRMIGLVQIIKEIDFDSLDCPHRLASSTAIILKAQTRMYICSSLQKSFYVTIMSLLAIIYVSIQVRLCRDSVSVAR